MESYTWRSRCDQTRQYGTIVVNSETDNQAASDFSVHVYVLGLECLTGFEVQDCYC